MKNALKTAIVASTLILWVGVYYSYKSSLYEIEQTPWEEAWKDLSNDIHSLRLHTDTTQYGLQDPYVTYYKDQHERYIIFFPKCETRSGHPYTPEKYYRINSKGDIVFNWAAFIVSLLWYFSIFLSVPLLLFLFMFSLAH